MKKYKVWLRTKPGMYAQYNGYVEVYADNEENAPGIALRKLTSPTGTFFDRSPGMFTVERVERIFS